MKRRIVIAILCVAPLMALANPYVLNPGSLIAFGVVVFWAMIVESAIVALLLAWTGMRVLLVFFSYCFCNALVYLLFFHPLQNQGWSVLSLELLVVGIDALMIKILSMIPGLQGDNFARLRWWQALTFSTLGNSSSLFLGFIAERKPWEA